MTRFATEGWPAVNDNPHLDGLFIAISMGTACAPSYVRLMMKLIGIDYGKDDSFSSSADGARTEAAVISAMTAAAAITRICGAPASVVVAATFGFPLCAAAALAGS